MKFFLELIDRLLIHIVHIFLLFVSAEICENSKGETAEFFDFNQIFNQKNQFNQKIDLIKKISLIKEKHLFSALFHRIYRNNHKQ